MALYKNGRRVQNYHQLQKELRDGIAAADAAHARRCAELGIPNTRKTHNEFLDFRAGDAGADASTHEHPSEPRMSSEQPSTSAAPDFDI